MRPAATSTTSLFSPLETATFGIDPVVIKRMRVPSAQIARIDPLMVLAAAPAGPAVDVARRIGLA